MKKSETIIELGTALALAQAEMSNPSKSSINPFFKSKYADLAEVINISKPTLAKFGLSVIQMPYVHNGHVGVETMLIHKSGEYISSRLNMPLGAKKDAQAVGSAITYGRRYALAALTNVSQEDDDGNNASGKKSSTVAAPVSKKRIEEALVLLNQHFEMGEDDKAKTILKFAEQEDVGQVVNRYYQLYPLEPLEN
jgi:hypothetical protein